MSEESFRIRDLYFNSKFVVPVLVSIVLFMEFLDGTIVNTAIPSISNEFGVNPLLLKFSVTSYFLAIAIFMPISGWCTDKFGTRRIFLFSIALFTIASLACSLANDLATLTFFRFLQGIGGAFMNPVARILVLRLFPPQELVKIQGYIFTPTMLGYVLGPFLGGILCSYLDWRWIFYINIPAGLFILHMVKKHVVQEKDEHIKKFDTTGFFLIAASLSLITVFFNTIGHYDILAENIVYSAGILGGILLVFFVLYTFKKKNPILDFSILNIRVFKLVYFYSFGAYLTNSAVNFLLPLMFQKQLHFSPAKSGIMVVPIALGYLFFRPLSLKLIPGIGFKRTLVYGLICIMVCLFAMSHITYETHLGFMALIEFIYGAAVIVTLSASGALIYYDVPKPDVSRATALDITSRQFAIGLGVAVSTIFLTLNSHLSGIPLFANNGEILFHKTLLLFTLFIAISLAIILRLRAEDGRG